MIQCADALALARLLHPAFRFHHKEGSLPFNPDVWLSHQSLDSDKGSVLVHWQRPPYVWQVGFDHKAPSGTPDLSKGPSQAGGIPFDRDTVSHTNLWVPAKFRPLAEDWFVSFGGWKFTPVSTVDGPLDNPQNAGDYEYVNKMIEPLSFANKRLYPNLNDPPPNPLGILHESFPTIWCEIEWAGLYPRMDLARASHVSAEIQEMTGPYGVPESLDDWPGTETQNFSPGMNGQPIVTDLDSYIALTYYLFLPLAAPPVVDEPNSPDWIWEIPKGSPEPTLSLASHVQEAHWEAITLFLAVKADPISIMRDPIGMPYFSITPNDLEGTFDLDRSYIVASRGWKNEQLLEWKASEACVRRLRLALPPKTAGHFPVELLVPYVPGFGASLTPVVYVSYGSHRCAFEANMQKEKPVTIGAKDIVGFILDVIGVVTGSLTGPVPMNVLDLPIGPICTVLPPPLSLICALIAALLSLILALLEILLAAEAFLTYGIKSFEGLLAVQQSWTPVTNEFVLTEKNGITVVPSPQKVPLLDPTVAPIYSVPATTHVVNSAGARFNATCSPPAWWNFAGSWGIRVTNSVGGWDNAGRRIDPYGRSKAYWNAIALLTARHNETSCLEIGARPDGTFGEVEDEFFPTPAFRRL